MFKTTVSSPTDSGGTGMSKPVKRKGIMLFTSAILGLVKGTEVEILDENGDYYEVKSIREPWIDKWVWKDVIKEVGPDA